MADLVKQEGTNGSLNKAGEPRVVKGRVEIQIWLNSLPADGLLQLKAAGFELAATLVPKTLVLGSIDVNKLDTLISLAMVWRVETPRMR